MDSQNLGVWVPLVEYSVKTGVSLSTIRRKIKSNTLPHRLERGKYLVLLGGSPSFEATAEPTPVEVPQVTAPPRPAPAPMPIPQVSKPEISMKTTDDAVRMMTDAFEYALREKEERIRLLERRNQDLESHLDELRLLVQVLEEKYEVHY